MWQRMKRTAKCPVLCSNLLTTAECKQTMFGWRCFHREELICGDTFAKTVAYLACSKCSTHISQNVPQKWERRQSFDSEKKTALQLIAVLVLVKLWKTEGQVCYGMFYVSRLIPPCSGVCVSKPWWCSRHSLCTKGYWPDSSNTVVENLQQMSW